MKARYGQSIKDKRIVGFINTEVPRKALRSQKEEKGHESENHSLCKGNMLLVVFATLMSVAGASAQTGVFSGKFTLPYQVRWGDAMLPAGDYSIRFSSIHSPATIHSMDGKISAYVFTARSGDSEKGPGSLTVVTRGNERRVAAMNLPEARASLVYSPLTNAERESLAKGNQIQSVPLVTAKK